MGPVKGGADLSKAKISGKNAKFFAPPFGKTQETTQNGPCRRGGTQVADFLIGISKGISTGNRGQLETRTIRNEDN